MWLLYQAALALALVAVGPVLLLLRGRHYLPTLPGRLGLAGPPPIAPGALWIHAVSVGEVGVARTLADHLPAGVPLLVTTITPTGQERARRELGGRAVVAYLPFDLAPLVARFLRRHRPCGLLLVEGDLWPGVLRLARRRGVPVAVVNGRVGDRSFSRWRRAPAPARRLLTLVDRFGVQTEVDRERLVALGAEPARVTVTGNLKYEAPPPPRLPVEELLGVAAGGRPLLVAGSTMAGEEEAVLAAFERLGGGERALLVLAPRHPERFERAVALAAAAGHPVVRRSALAGERRPAVVVLDTLGELAAVYRVAAAVFVGGTLSGSGGHNPLEPARFGTPIAVGPSMENFRDMAAQFDGATAWRRVADARELAAIWEEWLADPEAGRDQGERARRLVEANRGAAARTVALLAALFPALAAPVAPPAAVPAATPVEVR